MLLLVCWDHLTSVSLLSHEQALQLVNVLLMCALLLYGTQHRCTFGFLRHLHRSNETWKLFISLHLRPFATVLASDSAIYIYSLIYLYGLKLWFIYLVHWTLACNKCVILLLRSELYIVLKIWIHSTVWHVSCESESSLCNKHSQTDHFLKVLLFGRIRPGTGPVPWQGSQAKSIILGPQKGIQ